MKLSYLNLLIGCGLVVSLTACGAKNADDQSNNSADTTLKVDAINVTDSLESPELESAKTTAYDPKCYGSWPVQVVMTQDNKGTALSTPTNGEKFTISFPNKIIYQHNKNVTPTTEELLPVKYDVKEYQGAKNAVLVTRFSENPKHHIVFLITWCTEAWPEPKERNTLTSIIAYDVEDFQGLNKLDNIGRILVLYSNTSN